jgi:DNA-binding NarL/FixJ family response regulator
LSSHHLLVVDADSTERERLAAILRHPRRTIQTAHDALEALACLRGLACDVVVAGPLGDGGDPMELIGGVAAIRPQARVIITGALDPARALEAIRSNAYSYFHRPITPNAVADIVQQALEAHSWRDDIHVTSAQPEWISLEVRAKLEAVERTAHMMREIEADLPRPICEDVTAAFRELLLNAVEHGAHSDPRKHVRVSLVRVAGFLVAKLADPGEGFSLDQLPHAAVSNPAGDPTHHIEVREERGQRPGGFGILMARNLVDGLAYNERGNEVMFLKKIQ